MFAWLRSPRRRKHSTVRYEDGRPKAGYFALQDPYGSALDEFDDAFDLQPDAPRRKRRFWHRKPKLTSGIEQPRFGEHWREPETRWYQPSHYRGRRKRWWLVRLIAALLAIFIAIVAWLAITAPLGKSLEPIAPPQITLLASDGTPIARSGASVDAPVVASELPDHVIGAFLAIEDRRFYSHWGVDPRGIARAAWTGVGGGSTITQQLAKFTFLTPEQTLSRKAREALIAFWLETWLTKDEILSRYLSNAYFGDNQYGLRAASLHYFYRQPENLKPEQAAMLAGLLKAPSRLAPTRNYDLAEERMRLVIGAMAEEGYLTDARARNLPSPGLDVRNRNRLPTGTYFADWALPIARKGAEASYAKQTITTTLDAKLQGVASQAVASAPLGSAQVALVAMRPSGEVVAMIGGKDYANSPFNRATQAKRQPGSTFKLFVYLAALEAGMRPTDQVDNTPIEAGSYRPKNAGENYTDNLTLEQAFASSSNVSAVRLFNQLGSERVIETARNLGVTSPLPEGDPSLALGTSTMSLLELTSAYAAVAANAYPVEPHAFPQEQDGWIDWVFDGQSHLSGRVQNDMERLLRAAINDGTGKAAMLAGPNFGKTGTTQDYRDAVFVGYAGDLVVGVWVGNDDNSSLNGVTGGGLPARIWRNFMRGALAGSDIVEPAERPDPEGPIRPLDIEELRDIPIDDNGSTLSVEQEGLTVVTEIDGVPVEFRLTEDGLKIEPGQR
ncbi:MAG: penicillin-binding protein [Altererythrobacter sp.]|nr:penicillin-binding protein [Altererythrobacter sp.]